LKRPKVFWRQIYQNEGPHWEGVIRKFHGYPFRGFSWWSEKLSKKYALWTKFSIFKDVALRHLDSDSLSLYIL